MLFIWIGDNKCSYVCNVCMYLFRYLIIEKNDIKKFVQCLINGMGEVYVFQSQIFCVIIELCGKFYCRNKSLYQFKIKIIFGGY